MNPPLVENNVKVSEDICARCSFKIYPLELQNIIVRDQKYHKVCFKCFVCDNPLLLTNYKINQFDKNDKNIYCSAHVPKSKEHAYKGFTPPRNHSISVEALNDCTNRDSHDTKSLSDEKKDKNYCEYINREEDHAENHHQVLAKSQDVFVQESSNESQALFLIPENSSHNTNEMLIMQPGSNDENHYIKDLPIPEIKNYTLINTQHSQTNNQAIICNPKMILDESSCLGQIKITLFYDELRKRLSVTVHEAENLKNLHNNSNKTVSDPYCRVYLLPDDNQKSLKRKTKIIKNDLNPKWEETFDYSMSYEKALSKHLLISLKDKDSTGMFKKDEHSFMGEILLSLKNIQCIKNQYTRWIYLKPANSTVTKLLLSKFSVHNDAK